MGTKQRIGNEFTDSARVQDTFCFNFFIFPLPVLVTSVHNFSLDFKKSPSSYFIWRSRSAASRRKKTPPACQEVDL